MAEVTKGTIYALALDILAQVERLDADMLTEARAMRTKSEAFCTRLAECPAARQAH